MLKEFSKLYSKLFPSQFLFFEGCFICKRENDTSGKYHPPDLTQSSEEQLCGMPSRAQLPAGEEQSSKTLLFSSQAFAIILTTKFQTWQNL